MFDETGLFKMKGDLESQHKEKGGHPGHRRHLVLVRNPHITVDTREPWPHPWANFLPDGWEFERGTLETGDIALAALPEGAVIERKTPSDPVGCIGSGRERFERELRRGRYTGGMIVIVEGTLADVCVAGRRLRSFCGDILRKVTLQGPQKREMG